MNSKPSSYIIRVGRCSRQAKGRYLIMRMQLGADATGPAELSRKRNELAEESNRALLLLSAHRLRESICI